jgi:hypothetical protein
VIVDWRGLLNEINIEWKDRGPNCARGRVNINCPFCWDDPSCHCTISEATGRFYCYRDSLHFGDAVALVSKLKADKGVRRPRIEALALLDDYETTLAPTPPAAIPRQTDIEREYDNFEPAWESERYLDYLADERGFSNPVMTARQFNLRCQRHGIWARRLLLPLYDHTGSLSGWTGRSIDDWREPRYLAHPSALVLELLAGSLDGSSFVIAEGPMDALKFNSAMRARVQDCSAVGLTGLHLSQGRLFSICARQPKRLWLSLDANAKRSTRRQLQRELAKYAAERFCHRLVIPSGFKDLGEMPEPLIRDMMSTLIT